MPQRNPMGKILHASGSGYFPFCIQETQQVDPWDEPLSLKEAMSLYWKVKSWTIQVTGNLFYTVFRYEPGAQTGLFQTGVQTLDAKVCPSGVGAVSSFDVTLYSPIAPDGRQVGGAAELSIFSNFGNLLVKKFNNKYYALITVGVSYGGNIASNIDEGAVVGNYSITYSNKVLRGVLRAKDSYVEGGNIRLDISASSYFDF